MEETSRKESNTVVLYIRVEKINYGNLKKMNSLYILFKKLEKNGLKLLKCFRIELANNVEVDTLIHLILI